MSERIGNLLNCPTYKIEDRKTILGRTYAALLEAPEAVVSFKGDLHHYTPDEIANWEARETIAHLYYSL